MKQASVKSNFVMNAILAAAGFLFPLITFPYVSRVLLPVGTGKVALATSAITYFTMFAQLGIPTYGLRACARVRDDREKLSRTVHELLGINLAMAGISYGLLFAALLVIPKLAEERLLYIIMSVSLLLNAAGMEWLYKGLEQYRYITVRSIAFKLAALAAVFLLIHEEKDYILYGGISIFAASASNILNLVHARKYIDLRRPRDCNWRQHLKPVLVFFAMACAATIYTNLDTLMLGFMTGDADVGYYNAAVKIKGVLVSVVTALGTVLLPRASWYIEQGKKEAFRRMTQKAIRFVLLCAAGVSLYFILFAEEGILLLSGDAYMESILPMRIIMPTVLFIGLTNILGIQILVPLGKEKIVLRSEIAGAVVDLILNAVLIPQFRAAGAAAGTLAAEAVVLGVQYYALREETGELFRKYPWGKLAAGLVLAAAGSIWIKALGLGSLWSLMTSAVCFFGIYGGFMLWRKDEILTETLERVRQRLEGHRERDYNNRR